MMNLSSIMGSKTLCIAYPFHQISILAFLSDIQDVLLSTFKCTHIGFAPGIYLPDYEEQPQEELSEEKCVDDCAN